jgi:hypothetical protein
LNGTVIFVGPTLPVADVRSRLPEATILGPAEQGSVVKATLAGAKVIGLIDGCFHAVPAVWHKEILWALSAGVRVAGAASMGALRAAELSRFGMVGVGAIYHAFATGALDADDEVAVLHGTAESGYRPMSEPLVNIRANLARAVEAGVLSAAGHDLLVDLARAMFYTERRLTGLLENAPGLPASSRQCLARWWAANPFDQKRADALELLDRLASGVPAPAPKPAPFSFPPTVFWIRLLEECRARPAIHHQ